MGGVWGGGVCVGEGCREPPRTRLEIYDVVVELGEMETLAVVLDARDR